MLKNFCKMILKLWATRIGRVMAAGLLLVGSFAVMADTQGLTSTRLMQEFVAALGEADPTDALSLLNADVTTSLTNPLGVNEQLDNNSETLQGKQGWLDKLHAFLRVAPETKHSFSKF